MQPANEAGKYRAYLFSAQRNDEIEIRWSDFVDGLLRGTRGAMRARVRPQQPADREQRGRSGIRGIVLRSRRHLPGGPVRMAQLNARLARIWPAAQQVRPLPDANGHASMRAKRHLLKDSS
jgi:hypothetical protein